MINWSYFLLTLLIELPVVCFFFRKQVTHVLIAGFLLNLFTWPLLHVLLYTYDINVYLLEICVAVTESIGYRLMMNCSWKKALLVGFVANTASYGIGLLMNNIL